MVNRFIEVMREKIKAYNKTNKDKLNLDLFDKVRFEQYILDAIDDLVVVDIISNDVELHVRLVSFIDSVVNIDDIEKGKLKHVKAIVDDLSWLVQWYKRNVENDKDNQNEINQFDRYLYSMPEFASHRINSYINTLLSKTIDYLPNECHTKFDKLEPTLAMFDLFKARLNALADTKFILWVYVYTENMRYVPIRLRYLDPIDGLGSRVETWIDNNAFTPLTAYLNNRGYDVFSGWGNLYQHAPQVNDSNGPSLKFVEDKTTVDEKPMTIEQINHCINYAIKATYMFISNPKLNMNLITNQENYIYNIAIPIYHYSIGCKLTMGDVKKVINGVMRYYKSSNSCSKFYRSRKWKDRNEWFHEKWLKHIYDRVMFYRKYYWVMFTCNTAMHCFDVATIPLQDAWDKGRTLEENIAGHHHFLARGYNELYHGEKPIPDDALREAVKYFNDVLIPRYLPLIEEDRQWIMQASMEFLFNIENDSKVDEYYETLKAWLTVRNTTQANIERCSYLQPRIQCLSYRVKEKLLTRLDNEPIDVVSYGGSKERYQSLYEIIRKDVKDPVTEGRINNLDDTNEGERHVNI